MLPLLVLAALSALSAGQVQRECVEVRTQADLSFQGSDRNHDGILHQAELVAVFSVMDENGDGRISYREYMDFNTRDLPSYHNMSHALYQVMDANDDNHLTEEDFEAYYASIDADGYTQFHCNHHLDRASETWPADKINKWQSVTMKAIVALISAGILLCSKSEGCATSADCGDDECCVSIIRPLGRRQVSDDLTACRPIGTEGADCLLRDSVFSKNEWYFACPCKVGLTCIGNGVFDPPLGETGTCHHH